MTGTTVSYTDGNAEALTNYVKFELAAVASGTASVSSSFAVEDWGLILIQGATGTAAFTIAYAQGIPDNLRTALPQLNALRTTAAAISLGYGICSTDTYTKREGGRDSELHAAAERHYKSTLHDTHQHGELHAEREQLTGAKPCASSDRACPPVSSRHRPTPRWSMTARHGTSSTCSAQARSTTPQDCSLTWVCPAA